MTPERRFMLLDGIVAPGKANGRSVASVVENRLLGIAGNSLIMPVAAGNQLDPTMDETFDLFAQYYTEDEDPMRLSLPTKGVYAESVMGKCNSCEEKDESRFWRWEESPIPDSPTTPISILNTDSRRKDLGDLQPKDFANPIVNIQNAPNLPDPTGLQTALNLTGKGDAFRDLTGLNQNQLNALATFQKTMDTAQAFGKEAAELAKAAGAMKMLQDAQKSGTVSNEQAKEKGGEIIDQLQKDPNATRLNEGLGLIDKLEKSGVITQENAAEAKKNLLKTFTDSSNAKTSMSNDEIKNLSDTANSNNTGISVERPDGEKIEVTPKNLAVGIVVEGDTKTSGSVNKQVSIKRKREFHSSDNQTGTSRAPRVDKAVYSYEIKNDEIEPIDFFMQEEMRIRLKKENRVDLIAQTYGSILKPNQLVKMSLEFSIDPDNETIEQFFNEPFINRDFAGDPRANKTAGNLIHLSISQKYARQV
jgi:ribosomal protein S20